MVDFKLIKKLIIIVFGCMIASFGLNAFLIPNSIAAGGFSGISILLNSIIKIPVGTILFMLNAPLFILAFKNLGTKYVVMSLFGTVVYSLSIDILGFVPKFSSDLILCSVYGGLCAGCGYGIIIKYGASTGGTDIMAKLISKKRNEFPIGRLIFLIDVVVIGTSIVMIGLDRGLYAIIAVFLSTKMIDLIVQGTRKSSGFFIITSKGDEIATAIMTELARGVTVLNGKGAYTGKDKEVLICALNNKSEIILMKELIHSIDKHAFVLIGDMTEIMGQGFEKAL